MTEAETLAAPPAADYMMHEIFLYSCLAAIGLVIFALLLTVYRLRHGPTLMDRVLALDLLATLGIAFIAAVGGYTGETTYLDVALALALVGFLGTVAFAYFALRSHHMEHSAANLKEE